MSTKGDEQKGMGRTNGGLLYQSWTAAHHTVIGYSSAYDLGVYTAFPIEPYRFILHHYWYKRRLLLKQGLLCVQSP